MIAKELSVHLASVPHGIVPLDSRLPRLPVACDLPQVSSSVPVVCMIPQPRATDARRFVVGVVRAHERINLRPKQVDDLVLVSYELDDDDPLARKKVSVAKIHSMQGEFIVHWYGAKNGRYSEQMKNKWYPGWIHTKTKAITYNDTPGLSEEPYLGNIEWPEDAIVDHGFTFTSDTQKLKKIQLRKACAAPGVLFKMKFHEDRCECVQQES